MEIAQKKDYKCIVIAEYTVSILYRNKAKNEYPYVLNQLMGHAGRDVVVVPNPIS